MHTRIINIVCMHVALYKGLDKLLKLPGLRLNDMYIEMLNELLGEVSLT